MKSNYPGQLLANTCVLFSVWLVLSGRLDPPYLVIGGLVAFGVAWLNTGFPHSPFVHFPVVRALVYAPWIFLRIVESSVHVTKVIIHPSLPISPGLVTYETTLRHPLAVVMLGNSITLTPGTITVEAEGGRLLIHAIDQASRDDVLSRRLERKLAWVFREDTDRA